MDLTLRHLRFLLAVSEHLTISAAADALGYTPSAVSQQLAGLERACGAAVLERVGRNVRLTDAGRVLVDHAREVLAGAESALAAVARVDAVVEGEVTVAAYESVASTFGPVWLKDLRRRHPALRVHLRQIDPDASVPMLARGDIDLAFSVDYPHAPTPRGDGIEYWTIIHDQFHVVMADDDPLPAAAVDLATLADRSFISSPPELSCGRCVTAACRAAGFEPRIIHELDDYPTILRLVAAGEGIALIPDLGLVHRPPGIRTAALRAPVSRTVELAVRTASAARPAYVALRDSLLDVAADLALLTPPRAA